MRDYPGIEQIREDWQRGTLRVVATPVIVNGVASEIHVGWARGGEHGLFATIRFEDGWRCLDCGHVTRETNGYAGCCVKTIVPARVIVCPNCETIHGEAEAPRHVRDCYQGRLLFDG